MLSITLLQSVAVATGGVQVENSATVIVMGGDASMNEFMVLVERVRSA